MSFSLGDIDEAKNRLDHYVTVEISNVSIHGFPATGKTSVIRLAMGLGLLPDEDQDSTGVAEPPSGSIIFGDRTDDAEWKEFTAKGMLEALYKSVKIQAKPVVTAEVKHRAQPTSSLPRLTPSISLPSSPFSPPSPSPLPSQPSPSRPSPSSIEDTSATKHKDKIPLILIDIIKDLAKIRGSSRVFSTRLILISDSGGQPNYMDVFPLFVHSGCLALFTLKLNECLDDIPKLSYRKRGKEMTDMAKVQCSHKQLLESLVKSMSSFHPSLTQSSDSCRNAYFAVIGTFADKVDECKSESLVEKNKELAESLKAYKELQICQGILPINAITDNDKQRKKHMIELRRLINKSLPVQFNIKVLWFGFYLCLKSKSKEEERPILLLKECMDIGKELGMEEKKTREAIQFFHKLNLLLHCPTDALDNFVIINLTPIFDLVSQLISASFFNEYDFSEDFQLQLTVAEREKLKKHGSFSQQTLEENFTLPEPLNAKAFIDLLAEVKAVAIIEHSKQPQTIFMPCLLNYATEKEEEESMKAPYPLILRLKSVTHGCVPLPPGFSPTLIVLLLSSRLFSINHDDKQYRNIFVLRRCRSKGIVTIIERRVQLEIYFKLKGCGDREWYDIQSDVYKQMHKAGKRLGFDKNSIDIESSFPCSCDPPSPNYYHIASESASGQYTGLAWCEEIKDGCKLKGEELRWLLPGMLL